MKVFIIFVLIFGFTALAQGATNKIVCYYGSWATYRNGPGHVSIEDIDGNLCTHHIYAFIGLNPDGTIRVLDEWNDVTNGGFARYINLKQQNPGAKILVAIGGWNEGSTTYSSVVNSPSLRANFVNNIVSFTTQYGFDGFDIDWEYPGYRGGSITDRAAFVELLKDLRPKFDQRGLLLTAAVAASSSYHTTAYDVPKLSLYLDFINVMTYDFHGSYDGVTGQNSPLYPSASESTDQLSVHGAIQGWIQSGADPQKLVLGIGLYGRTFTLANPNVNGVGAPTVGPGNSGPYTYEAGMLTYLEICEKINAGGWTTVWDNVQMNPFSYKGNQWIGYDNIASIAEKVGYAITHNLGGVMVWSVESDDTKNTCGGGRYPLLTAINSLIELPTENPSTPTPPTQPPSTPPTEKPSTETPSSPAPSKCGPNVVYRDPVNCAIYYVCVPSGNGYSPVQMKCPSGLYFNTNLNVCDYPNNVSC